MQADIVAVYEAKCTAETVRLATAQAPSEVQSEGKCDFFGLGCDVYHLKKNGTKFTLIFYTGESDSDDSADGYEDAIENEPTGEEVGNYSVMPLS